MKVTLSCLALSAAASDGWADDVRIQVAAEAVADRSVSLAERIEACRTLQDYGAAADSTIPALFQAAHEQGRLNFELRFAALDALAVVGLARPAVVASAVRDSLRVVPAEFEPLPQPKRHGGIVIAPIPVFGGKEIESNNLNNLVVSYINVLRSLGADAVPALPQLIEVVQGRLTCDFNGHRLTLDCTAGSRAAAAGVLSAFRSRDDVRLVLERVRQAGREPDVKRAAAAALNGIAASVTRSTIHFSKNDQVIILHEISVPDAPTVNFPSIPEIPDNDFQEHEESETSPVLDRADRKAQLEELDRQIAQVEDLIGKIQEEVRNTRDGNRLSSSAAATAALSQVGKLLDELKTMRKHLESR